MYKLHVNQHGMKNQKGSAILAVLGAIIIVGVILELAGSGLSSQSTSIIISTRARGGRDSIAYQIDRYANLPSVFRTSMLASDNPDLQNCILGNGASACKGDGTEYPLSLYTQAEGQARKRFTGPGPYGSNGAHPVIFDIKGGLCAGSQAEASSNCPFEVYTTFSATCLGNAASCARADKIKVHYMIRTPESLASNSNFRGRAIFATIDRSAVDVAAKDILPPPFNYAPNKLTKVAIVGSETDAVAENVQQVISIIEAGAPGIDPFLAETIGNYLFTNQNITSTSLLTALAPLFLIDSDYAYGASSYVSREYQYEGKTVHLLVGELSQMKSVAQSMTPGSSYSWDLGNSGIGDIVTATEVIAGLAGVNTDMIIKALTMNVITDPTLAHSLNDAITQANLNDAWMVKSIVSAVKATDMPKDTATIKGYADLFLAANVQDDYVMKQVLSERINDLSTIIAMNADHLANPGTSPGNNPGGGNPGGGTNDPVPVPVAYVRSCQSAASCGNPFGL